MGHPQPMIPKSPQYKPAYEEDPSIIRDLSPEPTQGRHAQTFFRTEKEKRKMLESFKRGICLRLLF